MIQKKPHLILIRLLTMEKYHTKNIYGFTEWTAYTFPSPLFCTVKASVG